MIVYGHGENKILYTLNSEIQIGTNLKAQPRNARDAANCDERKRKGAFAPYELIAYRDAPSPLCDLVPLSLVNHLLA